MRFVAWSFIVACSILSSGCMLDEARGPSPILVTTDIQNSTTNESQMIDSLLLRAGFFAEDKETHEALRNRPDIGSTNWYYLVPAGFNYIDEKCNIYMRALYDLDRNRDRFKSGLVLVDKSSNAIMGVAGASSKVMQVTAQAFGMTNGLADVFVDRYEFKVEPTIVFLTLDKLRTKYREEIARRRDTVKSPGEALLILRNYLNICQPNSIEAVVNNYVALGEAKSNGAGGPASSEKLVTAERLLAAARAKRAELVDANKAVPTEELRSQIALADAAIKVFESDVARLRRRLGSSTGVADASGVRVYLGQ